MKFNLKYFRQMHNLLQREVAELLSINQSNVSRAEIAGFITLTYPQLQTLYDRFGKEDVDTYLIDESQNATVASNNVNGGMGTQNNGYYINDGVSLEIIRRQSEALANLASKQLEQTDRVISILEKLSDKL